MGLPGGSVYKDIACNAGDIPLLDWEDPLKEGMETHLPGESCLENPMDRGAWRATVQRVAQSQTQLKRLSTCASMLEECPLPQEVDI